jgi:hypothetical protein
MKYLIATLFAMLIACETPVMPDATVPVQEEKVIVNQQVSPPSEPGVLRHCKAIIIEQRRIQDGMLVLEYTLGEGVEYDEVRVKVLAELGDTGTLKLIKIYRDLSPGTVHRLVIPKDTLACDNRYRLAVWVEGTRGDLLDQCDGRVNFKYACEPNPECTTCECRGDCPTVCMPHTEPECANCIWDPVLCTWDCNCDGCIREQCNECQEWNPTLCTCVGECPPCTPDSRPECSNCEWNTDLCTWVCDCPECDIPPDQTIDRTCGPSVRACGPLGPPAAECSYFGAYTPSGDGPPLFWVTKCGLGYEVSHTRWNASSCTNGQDVSHRTPCWCAID